MATLDKDIASIDKFKEEFLSEFMMRVAMKTPVDTGKLKDGWTGEVKGSFISIGNDQPYAEFVENGTAHNAPVGMIKTTAHEGQQVADIAVERAKK